MRRAPVILYARPACLQMEELGVKHYPIALFILAALVLVLVVPPACAVLQMTTYKGSVTAVNSANATLSVNVTHQYGCTYEKEGTNCTWDAIKPKVVTGAVPTNAVLTEVKAGMPVEVVNMGGDGGAWTTVAVLVPEKGTEDWPASDVYGEPDAKLIGGYALLAVTSPDCSACTGTVCTAKDANVTVLRNDKDVFDKLMKPGSNFTYFDKSDQSDVLINFVKGEAAAQDCPGKAGMTGPQPVSVFIVHVSIGHTGNQTANATTVATTVATTAAKTTVPVTTKSPLPAVVVLGALGCAGVLFARQGLKR